MSIACNPDCYLCHMRCNVDIARGLGTQEQLDEFAKGLLRLYLQVPEGVSAVWTGPGTDELFRKIYGIDGDRYAQEKNSLTVLYWSAWIRSVPESMRQKIRFMPV